MPTYPAGLANLIRAGFRPRQALAMLSSFAEAAPAGGGGAAAGFGGTTIATPGVKEQAASGTGKRLATTNWTFRPYKSGQPGPSLVAKDANYGFAFAEAGWYQISAYLNVGFTGATLPDHFRLEYSERNASDGFIHDVPCRNADADNGSGRSVYGAQVVLPSHTFYQEGVDITLATANKLYLYWPTDAVATAGWNTGMAPSINLYVSRLG